jgi:hypothetical protein
LFNQILVHSEEKNSFLIEIAMPKEKRAADAKLRKYRTGCATDRRQLQPAAFKVEFMSKGYYF